MTLSRVEYLVVGPLSLYIGNSFALVIVATCGRSNVALHVIAGMNCKSVQNVMVMTKQTTSHERDQASALQHDDLPLPGVRASDHILQQAHCVIQLRRFGLRIA